MPTLRFFGLCAFIDFGDEFQVAMPTCMGHNATVSINSTDISVAETKRQRVAARLRPSVTTKQLEIPLFAGDRLIFADGSGSPEWDPTEREKAIDVSASTKNHQLVKDDQGSAVVVLPAGSLTAGPDSNSYDIYLGGDLIESGRDAPTSLIWQGAYQELLIINAKGIEQSVGTLRPYADVTIANLALAQGEVTNEHFNCYYDRFVRPSLNHFERVLAQQIIDEKMFTADVYDCVPPLPLP